MVAVLLLIVIIDCFVGFVGKKVVMSMPENNAYVSKTTYAMLKVKAELLVLGASKASHGYNSNILTDSLGLETYNAGSDGCDMMYYDMMLAGILSRCRPKVIILDMASLALDAQIGLDSNRFLYGISPVVDDYFEQNTSYIEHIKLKSSLYRYNGFYVLLASTYMNREITTRGYEPLDGNMNMAEVRINGEFHPNEREVYYFKSFIEKTKKYGIKLYVFISPSFGINPKSNEYVKKLCEGENVFFKDFSQEKIFLKPAFFKDDAHLNSEGADAYTKYIINTIIKNLH